MAEQSTGLISKEQALAKLDELTQDKTALSLFRKSNPTLSEQLMVAQRMQQFRTLMTDDIVNEFLPLMGSPLGFVTDRDIDSKGKGPYDVETVRTVAIQAFMVGARMVGNEVNIIAGRFYGAKNFFERAVREFPGLENLNITTGVPVQGQNAEADKAVVAATVTYTLNGVEKKHEFLKTEAIDARIPIRVNSGMGVDAIIGKATRKVLAKVYQTLIGYKVPDSDEDDLPPGTIETTATNTTKRRSKTEDLAAGVKGEATAPAESQLVAEHKAAVAAAQDVGEVDECNIRMLGKKPTKEERELCIFASQNRKAELLKKPAGTLL